jgi:hypothetical protein
MNIGISHLNHFHPTTHLLMPIAILFITLSCELLTSLVEYICYVRMRLENHKKNSTSLLFYLLHIYAITVVYLLTLSYPEVLLCTQIVKKHNLNFTLHLISKYKSFKPLKTSKLEEGKLKTIHHSKISSKKN